MRSLKFFDNLSIKAVPALKTKLPYLTYFNSCPSKSISDSFKYSLTYSEFKRLPCKANLLVNHLAHGGTPSKAK
jgi:hypothetical protein